MEHYLQQLQLTTINPGACAGGVWLENITGSLLTSFNPHDGQALAKVRQCSPENYQTIMGRAQQAWHQWRQVPAPKRGELIRVLGEKLRQNKDLLGTLVTLECGKSKAEGDGEVQEMIDIADFAVGQSRMLYGNSMHSERPQHRMYEQWHPLGIVGVISAFNFPVAVWAWNACVAAICGNVVVWKPSHKTPLTAIAVQHLCNEAMEETGYSGIFSYFVGEHQLAEEFVDDARLPLLSFTGSTAVGRAIGERVAMRMGKSILELGGNNAIIVSNKANLNLAIPGIVFGAVGTAGQRCTSTRRVFIQQAIFPKVKDLLMHAYQQLRVGDPMDMNHHIGPLIDLAAVQHFNQAIAEIKAAGGEILWGGESLQGPGSYVQPTLVVAKDHWPVVQRETFAPILYLIPYQELEEAIAMQNGVKQGLSSAIFTDDLLEAEHFLSAIGSDCGIANVNIGTSGAEIGGAFGGEKETGGGREAGSDAWKAYMRRQTNTINWGRELPLAQGIQFKLELGS